MEKQLRVLFVSSGNAANFEIAPFIKVQGESLVKAGVSVSYFPVQGRGMLGYLRGSRQLHKHLREISYDIIHAHYSLSGLMTVLAFPKQPIVLSLLGSDVNGIFKSRKKKRLQSYFLMGCTLLVQPIVSKVIVKSESMAVRACFKDKTHIIPNGVCFDLFQPNGAGSRKKLELQPNKSYILFLGNKQDKHKNFELAKKAFDMLGNPNIELLAPYPVSHQLIPHFLNASDVIVVTSFMEGSSNVIKEAMACCLPVVSTNVGDAAKLFADLPGHFITDFNPQNVAAAIQQALDFRKKQGITDGRKRLRNLGLDSETVASKIIDLYKELMINAK